MEPAVERRDDRERLLAKAIINPAAMEPAVERRDDMDSTKIALAEYDSRNGARRRTAGRPFTQHAPKS